MNGWMDDGWMDGWMGGWVVVDERMVDGWFICNQSTHTIVWSVRIAGARYGWRVRVEGRVHEWVYRSLDVRGQMWMSGRVR